MTSPTLPATEHRHVGGSAGGPGENSAECACGTVFAGFDTHAEAVDLLNHHVEQENGREKKRADQLAHGDIAVDILDSIDPWISHRDGKVLASYPYVDEVDNPRVLLVVEGDGSKPKPETVRLDAEVMVGLRSEAELKVMREQAERALQIADLRAFADFLERNPWAPIENLHMQWSPNPNGDIWNSGAEGPAQVRQMAQQMGAEAVQSDVMTKATRHFGPVEYSLIAWHKDGRPVEPQPPAVEVLAKPEKPELVLDPERGHIPANDLGFDYSRADDDPQVIRPHSPRVPLHTGAVVDGGQLVDETPTEVHTAEVYFSEAYREAFRLARRDSPGHRSSPELRTAAALDLLHGQALTEDSERTRRADVREGEQGRVTNPGVAYSLAAKEEERRTARHFLGLEESAEHYPAEPVAEAR
jgi:hypothetical protein